MLRTTVVTNEYINALSLFFYLIENDGTSIEEDFIQMNPIFGYFLNILYSNTIFLDIKVL